MSRVFEFGGSGIQGNQKIDLHDKNTPLADRIAFGLLFLGGVCCDDFNCSEIEMEEAMKVIESENIYDEGMSVFDAFAKRKDGKLKKKFNNPKEVKH